MDVSDRIFIVNLGLSWTNVPGQVTDRPQGVGCWQFNHFLHDVRLRLDGREQIVAAPAVIFFRPNQPQRYVATTRLGFSDDWLGCTGPLDVVLAEHGVPAGVPITVGNGLVIELWMQHLAAELSALELFADQALAEGLRHLVRLVARGAVAAKENGDEWGQAITALRMQLRERCGESWTIARMAQSLRLSPPSFARRYRKLCGTSPLHELTWFRIRRAQELLDTKHDITIATVAQSCGFSDQLYFSRVFHRWVGVAPTIYRAGRHMRQLPGSG